MEITSLDAKGLGCGQGSSCQFHHPRVPQYEKVRSERNAFIQPYSWYYEVLGRKKGRISSDAQSIPQSMIHFVGLLQPGGDISDILLKHFFLKYAYLIKA